MNNYNLYPEFKPSRTTLKGFPVYRMGEASEAVEYALLALFMHALATFEGFYIPESDPRYPSKAQRNNNPGNLRPIGASTGFRTFATALEGWDALKRQVMLNINRGLTLDEFFLGKEGVYPGYSPVADNTAEIMENYLSHMAKETNLPRNMDLRRFFPKITNRNAGELPPFDVIWTYKPYYAI